MSGEEAEQRASARVRTAENLDWAEWAARVNRYLELINALFWPELIVVGGGISENSITSDRCCVRGRPCGQHSSGRPRAWLERPWPRGKSPV